MIHYKKFYHVNCTMKSQEFKRLKNGRLDRLRLHLSRDDITKKQRAILRKEIERRTNIANQHARNKYLRERINLSIYDAKTPWDLMMVASRYKNVIRKPQINNLLQKSKQVAIDQEKRIMNRFRATRNQTQVLKSLRNMKRTLSKTKDILTPGAAAIRKLHSAANGIDVATFEKVPLKHARVIRQDLSNGRTPRFIYHKNTLQRMADMGTLKHPITRKPFTLENVIPLENVIQPSEAALYKKLKNGQSVGDIRKKNNSRR